MQKFSVKIPVKSYVKKYFCAIYGEKIEIDRSTVFGDVILTKLTNEPIKQFKKNSVEQNLHKFNDELAFYMTEDYFYRYDFQSITDQQRYSIVRFLENTITEDLFQLVLIGRIFNVDTNTVVNSFAIKYGINDDLDINIDSLTRKFRRYNLNSSFKNFFLAQMSAPDAGLKISANSYKKKDFVNPFIKSRDRLPGLFDNL
ncbi:hypothetical protein ACTJIJ_20000 [Niabella sp. 22666]|uniref:hypothetical protein n=1 Tax=Niabella sp. 22666 TaxID=3453954 RepID=UPI003F854E9E